MRRRLRPCRQQVVSRVGRVWRGQMGAHRLVLCRCGMGEERAAAALQWLVEHERLWGVLSIGFAGGLQPALTTGDVVLADRIQASSERTIRNGPVLEASVFEGGLVIPDTRLSTLATMAAQRAGLSLHHGLLWSHQTLVASVFDKRLLGRDTGALAVDMESYGIGALAASHRLPFVSMRAILDPYDMALDLPLSNLTTPDGGVRTGGAATAIMRQPRLLQSFWALWKLSRLARCRLGVWFDHFFTQLDTISSEEEG